MGIEHERIHIETSSVLIRQMPIGLVKSPSVWKHGPTGCKFLQFVDIRHGSYILDLELF